MFRMRAFVWASSRNFLVSRYTKRFGTQTGLCSSCRIKEACRRHIDLSLSHRLKRSSLSHQRKRSISSVSRTAPAPLSTHLTQIFTNEMCVMGPPGTEVFKLSDCHFAWCRRSSDYVPAFTPRPKPQIPKPHWPKLCPEPSPSN